MKLSGSIVSIFFSGLGIVSVLFEKLWFKIARNSGQDITWWHPWSKFTYGFLPWLTILCLVAAFIGCFISIKKGESLNKIASVLTVLWLGVFLLLFFTDFFVSSYWSQMLTAWRRWCH